MPIREGSALAAEGTTSHAITLLSKELAPGFGSAQLGPAAIWNLGPDPDEKAAYWLACGVYAWIEQYQAWVGAAVNNHRPPFHCDYRDEHSVRPHVTGHWYQQVQVTNWRGRGFGAPSDKWAIGVSYGVSGTGVEHLGGRGLKRQFRTAIPVDANGKALGMYLEYPPDPKGELDVQQPGPGESWETGFYREVVPY